MIRIMAAFVVGGTLGAFATALVAAGKVARLSRERAELAEALDYDPNGPLDLVTTAQAAMATIEAFVNCIRSLRADVAHLEGRMARLEGHARGMFRALDDPDVVCDTNALRESLGDLGIEV